MGKHLWISDNDVIKWDHDGIRYCLHIQYDEAGFNPRKDMDNICEMACWHRGYSLGDDVQESQPETYWCRLLRDNVPMDEINRALMSGKINWIRVQPNVEDPGLFDVYETSMIQTVVDDSDPKEYLAYSGVRGGALFDCVEDDLNVADCQKLLEPYAEWMPLWLYDHSGLSISCGRRTGQYADRWDSGCVGWIVALKSKVMEETVEIVRGEDGEPIMEEHKHEGRTSTFTYKTRPLTEDTWRERAIEIMESETDLYDEYLRDDLYCYTLYNWGDGDWVEEDSCGGFIGGDLMENGIADEVGCGLKECLESEKYTMGEATIRHIVRYEFG